MEPAAAALGQTQIAIDGAATARAARTQRTPVERKGYAATATPPGASDSLNARLPFVDACADLRGLA